MKLISITTAIVAVATAAPEQRNNVEPLSNEIDGSAPFKSYEERMVGILDNCGFFEDT